VIHSSNLSMLHITHLMSPSNSFDLPSFRFREFANASFIADGFFIMLVLISSRHSVLLTAAPLSIFVTFASWIPYRLFVCYTLSVVLSQPLAFLSFTKCTFLCLISFCSIHTLAHSVCSPYRIVPVLTLLQLMLFAGDYSFAASSPSLIVFVAY